MPALPAAAPVVLALETSGSACSAAVARGGAVLAARRQAMRYGHAEALLPMIAELTAAAGLRPDQIARVAVSVGPGGFTGIRVGLAAARGIALAAGAELVGVSSFAAVAAALPGEPAVAILVALDSRRADLYLQLIDRDGAALSPPAALLPDATAAWLDRMVGAVPLAIAGDAAEAAAGALAGRGGIAIVPDSAPDARGVLAAARRSAAVRSATPLYLRAPDVSLPKRAPAAIPGGG